MTINTNLKPKWYIGIDCRGHLIFVNTLDYDTFEATLIKVLKSEFIIVDSYHDEESEDKSSLDLKDARGAISYLYGEGSAYKFILDRDGQININLRGLQYPKEYDIYKLSKLDHVMILDQNGFDLKPYYLKEMNKMTSVKETVVKSASDIGSAALLGVKMAAVNKANEAAYNKVANQLIARLGLKEQVVNDPKVKEVIKFLIPLVLHPIAVASEGKVPHADKIKNYCEISIADNFRHHSIDAITFLTDLFGSMISAGEITLPVTKNRTDFSDLNTKALRVQAKKMRIDLSEKAKRNELIKALEDAEYISEASISNSSIV